MAIGQEEEGREKPEEEENEEDDEDEDVGTLPGGISYAVFGTDVGPDAYGPMHLLCRVQY
eukprot:2759364-Rhodomonas_salina.1